VARSVYIYVAEQDGKILATFTVKHELRSWARGQLAPSLITFLRCKDNPRAGEPAIHMTVEEVLGDR
jgi:hypothetical protein